MPISPQLEETITALSRKGHAEEHIYLKIKESKKIKEECDLSDVYHVTSRLGMAESLMGRDDKSKRIGTRIFGVLCLVGSVFVLANVYSGANPSRGKNRVGGYAVLLGIAGIVLTIKPRMRFDD